MDKARGDDDCGRGMTLPALKLFPLAWLTFCFQRALANQPWKEYTAEGGRKYWYNTETKQSSWEMPDVYKKAIGGAPTTPAYVFMSVLLKNTAS